MYVCVYRSVIVIAVFLSGGERCLLSTECEDSKASVEHAKAFQQRLVHLKVEFQQAGGSYVC